MFSGARSISHCLEFCVYVSPPFSVVPSPHSLYPCPQHTPVLSQRALDWACSSMARVLSGMHKALGLVPSTISLCVVAHTYNLSTHEIEARKIRSSRRLKHKEVGIPTYTKPVASSEEKEHAQCLSRDRTLLKCSDLSQLFRYSMSLCKREVFVMSGSYQTDGPGFAMPRSCM